MFSRSDLIREGEGGTMFLAVDLLHSCLKGASVSAAGSSNYDVGSIQNRLNGIKTSSTNKTPACMWNHHNFD